MNSIHPLAWPFIFAGAVYVILWSIILACCAVAYIVHMIRPYKRR